MIFVLWNIILAVDRTWMHLQFSNTVGVVSSWNKK